MVSKRKGRHAVRRAYDWAELLVDMADVLVLLADVLDTVPFKLAVAERAVGH